MSKSEDIYLAHATFDEIWDELTARHRGAILMVDDDDKIPGGWHYRIRDHGSPAHVLGIANMIARDIERKIKKLEDEFQKLDEEDDECAG